tara:strand:+ start:51 stop:551 length:501 start_codon:yes stop_codon:yes gene_type:complete
MKNIFLIGMMGSGKTTIGKILSKELSMPLLDMDEEIEKILDMKITKFFEEYGENRFRLIESAFFKECAKNNHFIYATGGGIILDSENRNILKNYGQTLFLDCNVETLISRLEDEKEYRPLLNNDIDIENIYNNRKQLYLDSSHYVINTTLLSLSESVKKIITYINK